MQYLMKGRHRQLKQRNERRELEQDSSNAEVETETKIDRAFLHSVDEEMTNILAVCASPDSAFGSCRFLCQILEYSCHFIPWIIVALLSMALSLKPKSQELSVNLTSALLIDLMIVGALKTLVRRPRPKVNKQDMFATVSVDNFSFPSGHATRAMLIAIFCLDAVNVSYGMRSWVAMWATFVCLSRIFLGRHYFSDVFSGALIGIVEYYIVRFVWIKQIKCVHLLQSVHYMFYDTEASFV